MTYDPPGPIRPPQPPEPPTYQAPPAYQPPPVYQPPPAYQPPSEYAPPAYQPPGQAPAQPPYVGYSQQPTYQAQGYPVASYPGYGAAPGQSAPPAGVGGLPIAAIIVSSVAFLIGLLPFVGALAGIAGLVLSILAVRRPRGRVLGIIGIVLSSLALLTSLLMTLGFITSVLNG